MKPFSRSSASASAAADGPKRISRSPSRQVKSSGIRGSRRVAYGVGVFLASRSSTRSASAAMSSASAFESARR